MLGGERLGERERVVEVARRGRAPPRRPCRRRAAQVDRVEPLRIVGHRRDDRPRPVLGLSEQIERDQLRVGRAVGEHERRRTARGSRRCRRRRTPGAWPLGPTRCRGRQSRRRARSTRFRTPAPRRRGRHRRAAPGRHRSARTRRAPSGAPAACRRRSRATPAHARRDDAHDDGRGVRRAAAGHVDRRAADGGLAQRHGVALGQRDRVVRRQPRLGDRGDVGDRDLEAVADRRLEVGQRVLELHRRDDDRRRRGRRARGRSARARRRRRRAPRRRFRRPRLGPTLR